MIIIMVIIISIEDIVKKENGKERNGLSVIGYGLFGGRDQE
jgi:hypothetical protein